MKQEYQQIIENDNKDSKQFIPFRNRKSYWGDRSMRPMIPNVVTVIPPDVDPELLGILLNRMKLEENAYKQNNLDSQAVNTIWLENKIDTYLFPQQEDAILSKAYECIRFEKYSLFKEIDQALPPVLPPPIILSATAQLPVVRPIKTPFSFSVNQDQDSLQDQSGDSEYSDETNQLQKAQTNEKSDQEDDNSDISTEYSSQQQKHQIPSNKQFYPEKQNNDLNQYGNSPTNVYSYKQSYSNYNSSNDRQQMPFEEERRRQQPIGYFENTYGNTHLPQLSEPPLPYQDSNKSSAPYSNPPYGYPPKNYNPRPPPYMHNIYDRNSMIPPPPPPSLPPQQQQPFYPIPPPPPLVGKERPSNSGNSPENGNGNQTGNQWNRYGKDNIF